MPLLPAEVLRCPLKHRRPPPPVSLSLSHTHAAHTRARPRPSCAAAAALPCPQESSAPAAGPLDLAHIRSLATMPTSMWSEIHTPGTDAPFMVGCM